MRYKNNKNLENNKSVRFYFDNKKYFGFEGDTLASALLANDVHLVGRSFKYHRPRGIYTAGSEEPNGIVQLETKEYTCLLYTSTSPRDKRQSRMPSSA